MKKSRRQPFIPRILYLVSCFLLLASCLLYLSCKGNCIKRDQAIQPSAPSEVKFKAIANWIPIESSVLVSVDIYKLTQSNLWDKIVSAASKSKLVSYFKEASGLNLKSDIGMIAAFLDLREAPKVSGPLFLIQGGFNHDLIISRIRNQATLDNVKLEEEKYKGITIYSEIPNGEDELFAFTALQSGLVALGKKKDIKWMLDNKPSSGKTIADSMPDIDWSKTVWGKANLSGLLTTIIPEPWNMIETIELFAALGEDLQTTIVIKLAADSNPSRLVNALEGFKALEALKMMGNREKLAAIDNINISAVEGKIVIEIPASAKFIQTLLSEEAETEVEVKVEKEDEDED